MEIWVLIASLELELEQVLQDYDHESMSKRQIWFKQIN